MRNAKKSRKVSATLALPMMLLMLFGLVNVLLSQTQRNPVLEFCTGVN